MNLSDLTGGDYRVIRALSYPDHPDSLVVFDVLVTARTDAEWVTEIAVNGRYTGPTDVLASEDYRLTWTPDGGRVLEWGSASLACASGGRIRQVWSSIISPAGPARERTGWRRAVPAGGQVISATISPFEIDGARMRYEWKGTVARE